MTPEEQIERNVRDLASIQELEKNGAFQNYFLRRLKERQAEVQAQILNEDRLTKDQREELRAVWKEYESIFKLFDRDRAALKSMRS